MHVGQGGVECTEMSQRCKFAVTETLIQGQLTDKRCAHLEGWGEKAPVARGGSYLRLIAGV
eukprot:1159875-Pelagomonas_calceolata.AAC.2